MPAIQLECYKNAIEEAKSSEAPEGDSKTGMAATLKILQAIRDISDHPFLAGDQFTEYNATDLINASAKLLVTINKIKSIRELNEKVIVFADRKQMQKILQKVIYDNFGIMTSIINGDTPTTRMPEKSNFQSRQQTIDRFSASPGFGVIIMSPLAAGVGLNVTAANHVIHYSRHWNPAKEEQATDRAYRIGQTKQVSVHYPMAVFPSSMVDEKGVRLKAFDEILDTLLSRKLSLASSTLFPTAQAEVRTEELMGSLFDHKFDT